MEKKLIIIAVILIGMAFANLDNIDSAKVNVQKYLDKNQNLKNAISLCTEKKSEFIALKSIGDSEFIRLKTIKNPSEEEVQMLSKMETIYLGRFFSTKPGKNCQKVLKGFSLAIK